MKTSRPIEFDLAIVYGRAAVAAVRATLAQSHGSAFADGFVDEHAGAILRAAKGRMHGRMEYAARVELQTLRRAVQFVAPRE